MWSFSCCGSTSLIMPLPLEIMLVNVSFAMRHHTCSSTTAEAPPALAVVTPHYRSNNNVANGVTASGKWPYLWSFIAMNYTGGCSDVNIDEPRARFLAVFLLWDGQFDVLPTHHVICPTCKLMYRNAKKCSSGTSMKATCWGDSPACTVHTFLRATFKFENQWETSFISHKLHMAF